MDTVCGNGGTEMTRSDFLRWCKILEKDSQRFYSDQIRCCSDKHICVEMSEDKIWSVNMNKFAEQHVVRGNKQLMPQTNWTTFKVCAVHNIQLSDL